MVISKTLIIGIAIAVVIIIILASGYVKASPDTAYIISGVRKMPRVLIGKAGIKIPFFEKKDELKLQLISISVETASAVPTADYINIRVDATVNVKVSDNPERLRVAAQNFLNKDTKYIAGVAREVLEGNVREIVGKMQLEQMISDRQKFSKFVEENAKPDLERMGLDIVSFNVQNFSDEQGVIENLGVDNIVRIKKAAAISRAESERDIQQAQATTAQEAAETKVQADTIIAERNNDLAVKKAELKVISDKKQAEADAAYEIQKQISRKSVEVETQMAEIAKREKEIELKEREAEVAEKTLDAEVRKKAEAEKYAAMQKADADLYGRQKQAEAELYENEKQAEALRKKGLAEADAIRAKGEAEADAMDKKAEAMKKYGQAAILEMIVGVLPDMAKSVAEPLSAIDKVTVIGGDSHGVTDLGGNVPVLLAKTMESVKEATGIDMGEIIRANTYDAKVKRDISVTADVPLQAVADVAEEAIPGEEV